MSFSRPHLSRTLAVSVLLVLPWLDPYAPGPSSSVAPWLFSALCAAAAVGLRPGTGSVRCAGLALASLAGWALLRTGLSFESLALAFGCLLVFMSTLMVAGESQAEAGRTAGWAWLVAAGLSTAMALAQYFGLSEHLAPWVSVSDEAFANLRQRNQFASLTAIGTAAAIWWVPRDGARWRVAAQAAAVAMLAIGNAATSSRTGLVEMVLLGVLAFLWRPRRQAVTLWLVGMLAYVLATVALPWLLETFTGATARTVWERAVAQDVCSSRMTLWANVLHLIAQKPWLGWGWGELDYAHYITLYEGPRFCDILDNAHNLPLHLAVELGLPAALLACAAAVWAVARARPWNEREPARRTAWAVLALLCLHSLVEYPLWYGPFQMAAGFCLGLLWLGRPGGALAQPRVARALAALLCGCCLAAAWDYHRASQVYLPPQARDGSCGEEAVTKGCGTWLFRNQARFAELTLTPLTRENAAWTYDTAVALLHYSPEPRVIEKVIESAMMLGREQDVLLHMARMRAAFPDAYAAWSQAQRRPPAP